ncbi:MAG: hypothetical protein L0287_23760 [Anaerolineae bacterium]|nr:hypothetical protein [Anaerolineae bacterium]MCI0607700.1 hypothetical protein [Anaerolineae bacterium]
MNKSFIYKLVEKFIDKKFYTETWYNYLTGEWHTLSLPNLKDTRGSWIVSAGSSHISPVNLIAMIVENPWLDFGEDSWVQRRPVLAPGCAIRANKACACLALARNWN